MAVLTDHRPELLHRIPLPGQVFSSIYFLTYCLVFKYSPTKGPEMKNFLAIFTCAENSQNHQAWMKLDAQTQKERFAQGLAAQEQWAAKYNKQIVYEGAPLSDRTKKVDAQGVHNMPSLMGNFMVIQAESHDEAAKMFLEHPHFHFFPGDGVDILECLENTRGSN